jgi:hypothetical protein
MRCTALKVFMEQQKVDSAMESTWILVYEKDKSAIEATEKWVR